MAIDKLLRVHSDFLRINVPNEYKHLSLEIIVYLFICIYIYNGKLINDQSIDLFLL